MGNLTTGNDALFILLGAIMVLAMHAGFAFWNSARSGSQVNALVKIMTDFAVSTLAYFFIGYVIAYGVNFFTGAEELAAKNGYELVKFFFLLTFAAAIPAIVSGGIASALNSTRRWQRHLCSSFHLSFLRRHRLEPSLRQVQDWLHATFGAEFHDFAGSVVVQVRGRRLDRLGRSSSCWRTSWSLQQRRPHLRAPALQHPPSWHWAHGYSP